MLGKMDESRRISEDNLLRIKIGLDNVSTSVMIADEDRNIIYLNKSVQTMFAKAEKDLKLALPSFSVDNLMGSTIDQFRLNVEHQKQILSHFTQSHAAQISIGSRTFTLSANAVVNDAGQRLGSVLEWNDVTEQLRLDAEKKNSRVRIYE